LLRVNWSEEQTIWFEQIQKELGLILVDSEVKGDYIVFLQSLSLPFFYKSLIVCLVELDSRRAMTFLDHIFSPCVSTPVDSITAITTESQGM
jgi:hypothetical protein